VVFCFYAAQLCRAAPNAPHRRPLDSSSLVWPSRNARMPIPKRRLVAPRRHETQRRLYRYFDAARGGRARGPAAPAAPATDNPRPRPDAILRRAPPIPDRRSAVEKR